MVKCSITAMRCKSVLPDVNCNLSRLHSTACFSNLMREKMDNKENNSMEEGKPLKSMNPMEKNNNNAIAATTTTTSPDASTSSCTNNRSASSRQHKTMTISKYFSPKKEQDKRQLLEDSGDEFQSPELLTSLTYHLKKQMKTSKRTAIKPKRKLLPKNKSIDKRQQLISDAFQAPKDLDIDADDLQLALALSASMQVPEVADDAVADTVQQNVATTLERYGFCTDKKKLPSINGGSKSKRGEVVKRSAKRSQKRPTFTPLHRISIEERNSKNRQLIATVLIHLESNVLHKQEVGTLQKDVNLIDQKGNKIASKRLFDRSKQLSNDYYVDALCFEQHTAKIDCLLRDWSAIPGRETSPLRNQTISEVVEPQVSPDLFADVSYGDEDVEMVTANDNLVDEDERKNNNKKQDEDDCENGDEMKELSGNSLLNRASICRSESSLEVSTECNAISSHLMNAPRRTRGSFTPIECEVTNSHGVATTRRTFDSSPPFESVEPLQLPDFDSANLPLLDTPKRRSVTPPKSSQLYESLLQFTWDDVEEVNDRKMMETPSETANRLEEHSSKAEDTSLSSQETTFNDDELNYSCYNESTLARLMDNDDDKEEQEIVSLVGENQTGKDHRQDVIIRRVNVTPMPDYDAMSSPQLVRELSRYGVKPMKRHRGVELLNYIYESTHPLLHDDESEEEDDEALSDRARYQRSKSSQKVTTAEEQREDDCPIFECRQSKKVAGCSVPLHLVWCNLLAANPQLAEGVLLYEPLQLEVLHDMMKAEGYNFRIDDLLMFLDKKCVTVRIAQKGSRSRRPKKKKNK